jgi:hypothetical protein
MDTCAPIAAPLGKHRSVWAWVGRLLAACALLMAVVLPREADAAEADAGECARNMVRSHFVYLTPEPRYRDPRTQLPPGLTIEQRRELHPVLWPSDFSGRLTVRQWLFDRNFACIEEGFADLTATQARYPEGALKVVSFLGGTRDFIDSNRGMTEEEIDELIAAWRAQYPKSLLAELLWPRLLIGAAWNERGRDWAINVAPDRMREFRRLSAAAMRRAQAQSPEARAHVLGHYVALRIIADNGASVEQIRAAALASLARFPQETGLAVIAADRMLPKWGASPDDFEDFARSTQVAVGPALADRTYASLYLFAVGLEQLHLHPRASLQSLRAGLVDLASLGTFEGILALQEFSCAQHDAEALRRAQALWEAYAAEPQLRGPQKDLAARCRAWERSLPPVSPPAPASLRPALAEPAARAPNLFHPAAPQDVAKTLYDVDAGTWERLQTPSGEVFTCKACEYPVQVLVTVGPPLAADAGFADNDRFMAALASPDMQTRVARAHTEQGAQLDAEGSNYDLKIEKTEFAEVDGVKAFRYESVLRFRRAVRETALELVHKGRMLRIAVSRGDGPAGPKEREAVPALIGSIRLHRE